jgi:HEAT repeat protein
MEDVRAALDPEEPDYAEAQKLGPEAAPHLKELVQGPDLGLASKAAYLASLIESEGSLEVLTIAATSAEPVLRVAAASAIRNLPERDAERVMDLVMEDKDAGVRKVTLRSAAQLRSPRLAAKIRKLAEHDPESSIRALATEIEEEMK